MKPGDRVKCTQAESPGYKSGEVYEVVNYEGVVGIWGRDGYFDMVKNLMSKFEVVEDGKRNLPAKPEGQGKTFSAKGSG